MSAVPHREARMGCERGYLSSDRSKTHALVS
jgi:hypothetical protein